tara:strand:+ start:208 stop:411 length:204 start_codon:yes stop_codon:yes gene_type:complete
MKNLKEFTVSQVGNIFKIEKFKTLTPVFYKGKEYQFQFDFKAEEKGERILNIIKIGTPLKVVGFFRY